MVALLIYITMMLGSHFHEMKVELEPDMNRIEKLEQNSSFEDTLASLMLTFVLLVSFYGVYHSVTEVYAYRINHFAYRKLAKRVTKVTLDMSGEVKVPLLEEEVGHSTVTPVHRCRFLLTSSVVTRSMIEVDTCCLSQHVRTCTAYCSACTPLPCLLGGSDSLVSHGGGGGW
jgi:hypothetical protein